MVSQSSPAINETSIHRRLSPSSTMVQPLTTGNLRSVSDPGDKSAPPLLVKLEFEDPLKGSHLGEIDFIATDTQVSDPLRDVGRKCSQTSVKISFKGSGGNILRYDCGENKAVASCTVCKNGNMDNRQNDFPQSSSKHVDSGRFLMNMHNSVASSGKVYKISTTGSQKSNLYSDVDGASIVIDRDNADSSSHPPSLVVPSEKGQ